MIFAKLDVDFYDHPRFISVGLAAVGLWACALAYCRKHTFYRDEPGRFPKAVDFMHRVGAPAAAKSLVKAGLWTDRGDSYAIHNYDSKNETAEDVAVRRANDAERQRRWRESKKAQAVTSGHDSRHGSRHVMSQPPRDGHVTGSDSGSRSVIRSEERSRSDPRRSSGVYDCPKPAPYHAEAELSDAPAQSAEVLERNSTALLAAAEALDG